MEDKTVELQFITHFTDTYSYYDSARMALEGGCRWIQLRMKDTPVDEVEREAIRLQGLCKDYGATFVIDDHVELVKKIHADGVHLGKKDMPVAEARGILGKEFIIGGTANTFDDGKMHYKPALTTSAVARSVLLLQKRISLQCWDWKVTVPLFCK